MTGVEWPWVQVGHTRDPIYAWEGVWWDQAPKPRRWHRCRPQTWGWIGLSQFFRCACGAGSFDGRTWTEKNSRAAHS
jgi:hypothetical protein